MNGTVDSVSRRAGFTLMELIVASALMSSLMMGLWGLVNIFTSLSDRGTNELRRIREGAQLFQLLESDLRSVPESLGPFATSSLQGDDSTLVLWRVAPPNLDWLGPSQPQAQAKQNRRQRIAPLQSIASDRNVPSIPLSNGTTSAASSLPGRRRGNRPMESRSSGEHFSVGGDAWPSVRRVRYHFRNKGQRETSNANAPSGGFVGDEFDFEGPGTGTLWRYDEQSASADEQWLGTSLEFKGVEAIRLSYYNGQRWTSDWDSAAQGGLPVAIRIEAWLYGGSPLAPRIDDAMRQSGAGLDVDASLDGSNDGPSSTALPSSNSSWSEALSAREPQNLPDRPADLTRWAAMR